MAGAASTVGIVAVVAALGVAFAAVGGGAVVATRLAGTADAAALAAADAVSGAVEGEPCARATQVAEAGGAMLRECDVAGLVATVTVAGAYGGISLDARSRAGPPDVSSP